jgi:hypothetical protein
VRLSRFFDNHAIAPSALGFVKSFICPFDQRIQLIMFDCFGNANADSDTQWT